MTATLARPSLADRYAAEFPGSRKLYEQARQVFPGGVTHDLRLMEPFPVYGTRAKGAHKWDVDGHELIDSSGGDGARLRGPARDDVVAAVQAQMAKPTRPGSCHESEIIWGQWVQKLVP